MKKGKFLSHLLRLQSPTNTRVSCLHKYIIFISIVYCLRQFHVCFGCWLVLGFHFILFGFGKYLVSCVFSSSLFHNYLLFFCFNLLDSFLFSFFFSWLGIHFVSFFCQLFFAWFYYSCLCLRVWVLRFICYKLQKEANSHCHWKRH